MDFIISNILPRTPNFISLNHNVSDHKTEGLSKVNKSTVQLFVIIQTTSDKAVKYNKKK